MTDRLMGIETEYAFTALTRDGRPLERGATVRQLLDRAYAELTHLPACRESGLFLANGARFYVDCGWHPEYCTPECPDPWQTTRHVAAGELLLAELARSLEKRAPDGLARALFLKSNVDYSGAGTSWGCHQSYLHRSQPADLARHLTPHLASRVVFAGAGGFDPFSPGLVFSLSPRSLHLALDASPISTGSRGLYRTKNETLSGEGWNRAHLLCGESLTSQLASVLKLGTTALVIALIEGGRKPGEGVTPREPVTALRAFAADPTLATAAPVVARGRAQRRATALDIQRRYLEAAEQALGQPCLPSWAEALCKLWRRTLDGLAADPGAAARALDWPAKQRVFARSLERRGLTAERLAAWNEVTPRLTAALPPRPEQNDRWDVTEVLGRASPVRAVLDANAPVLRNVGLSWDDYPGFVSARAALLEMDMRFAELGPRNPFALLERGGHFDHRVAGVDPVAPATTTPPTGSRARLRGEAIGRLARERVDAKADWDAVYDLRGRLLDLSEPFATEEEWLPFDLETMPWLGDELFEHVPPRMRTLLRRVRARLTPPGDGDSLPFPPPRSRP